MSCQNCATAAQVMHHGFTAGCAGCCARAAARSPHYRRCQDAGVQDHEYRRLLEQFNLTHEQVRQAAASDALRHSSEARKP